MCGICGLVTDAYREQIPEILAKMNAALVHRGPDDSGQYCHGNHGIAMRRLSIIDVAGGHQPIFNEDHRLAIVLNGEIYNFRELAAQLKQQGHHFSTRSDTEVVIHQYEDAGCSTPQALKGMFAFCIYDHSDESLFLARDRFGEKPLFYSDSPAGFAFSSEIKSLLQCPFVQRKLDYEALGYYLRVGAVPTPLTMFKHIKVLPPGHWLKRRAGKLALRPYYEIDYRPDPQLEHEADAIEAVEATLALAVKRQAISDVPLGAFLSGGIDSSTIVAMLQAASDRPVKTFTMRFEEPKFDEGLIAREVARYLGTEHHEFVVPNMSFEPEIVSTIVDHLGVPFVDDSAIPTYILSKHIREQVTVALSGDGGDEMFAGYSVFQVGKRLRQLQNLPQWLLRSGYRVTTWLSQQPLAAKAKGLRLLGRGLKATLSPPHLLPIFLHTLYEPEELHGLLRNTNVLATATGDLNLLTDLPERAEDWSVLRQLMYYRLRHNLHNTMLPKVDRMSMAASIEVRAPLLDVDVADLSMRLPDKHLIQNGVGKSILHKTLKGKLPEVVFNHPKTGFSVPLHRFQNKQYEEMAQDLLLNQTGIMQLFSAEAVNETIHAALHHQADTARESVYRSSHQLWALIQLAAWEKHFDVSL